MFRAFEGLVLLMLLTSCSTFDHWASLNANQRQFQIRKLWVQSGPEMESVEHRRMNKMSPVFAGNLVLVGNSVDGMVAWDRESGRELWRIKTLNGVEGGALVIRDRLFFGASDGFFRAVHVKTGVEIWKTDLRSEVLSAPSLDGETGTLVVQTASNAVIALEGESGKTLWVYSRPDANHFSIRGTSQPVIHQGSVYTGFSDGSLVALNLQNGQLRWEQSLNKNKKFRDVDTTPLIDEDRLYVAGYDEKLYCLSLKQGEVLWRLDEGGYAGLSRDSQRVYFPTSDGKIKALNRRDGKELWSVQLEKGISTSVVPMKGLLVFGESQGSLRFLDASNGKSVGGFEPGRGLLSTPLVDEKNSRVYFISGEANVYALEVGWKSSMGLRYLK